MAVGGIILRWEGVRKDEAIEFVTVACLLVVELWVGLSCSGDGQNLIVEIERIKLPR